MQKRRSRINDHYPKSWSKIGAELKEKMEKKDK